MSFSDRPTLSPGQKLGCFGFGAVLFAANFYVLLPSFLPGDCLPVEPDCKDLGILDWLPLFSLVALAALIWWMMRDRSGEE